MPSVGIFTDPAIIGCVAALGDAGTVVGAGDIGVALASGIEVSGVAVASGIDVSGDAVDSGAALADGDGVSCEYATEGNTNRSAAHTAILPTFMMDSNL